MVYDLKVKNGLNYKQQSITKKGGQTLKIKVFLKERFGQKISFESDSYEINIKQMKAQKIVNIYFIK